MVHFSEIFIQSFRSLKSFNLCFNKKQKSTLNLNLLVGKNGAGKSTFLDALFEIAINTNNPNCSINFFLTDEQNELLIGNCDPITYQKLKEPKTIKNFWKKAVKFYTGNSNRHLDYKEKFTEDYLSFARNDVRFVLSALFLSGHWNKLQSKEFMKTFKNIIFQERATFNPVQVWLDVENYEEETFPINNIVFEKQYNKTYTRLIAEIKLIPEDGDPFLILDNLLKYYLIEKDEPNNIKNKIQNTGFFYKKDIDCTTNNTLFVDETLSDGELGFIRRFALIMLMRELKGEENRSLLLLDEPETHFNENWKRHFIYLIEEALKDTYHDIFIATHSAMLITDVKRDELYHFELVNDKIKTFPVSLNTYATNIVDIGKALFDLEADIGERSKNELENLIKGIDKTTNQRFKTINKHKQALMDKLKEVGPGEWRWKIRSKINQLEKADSCCNYNNKGNNDNDS